MALTARDRAQRTLDRIDAQIEKVTERRDEAARKVTERFDERLTELRAEREHAADAPALRESDEPDEQ